MQIVGINKILCVCVCIYIYIYILYLLLIARNMFNIHERYLVHILPLMTLFYVKIRLMQYIYVNSTLFTSFIIVKLFRLLRNRQHATL